MPIVRRTRPKVKSAFASTRPARPFGEGIWPDDTLDRTDAPNPAEPDWDWLAAESTAIDCLERGLIPPDLARTIARTSLVGHDA